MRERILAEIHRLAAANGGKPPGRRTFEVETGIRYGEWFGIHWARWSDALAEAGYSPNSPPTKTDEDEILRQLVKAFRHYGRMASEGDLRLYGRSNTDFPSTSVISKWLGNKADITATLRRWISDKPENADVAAMLPADDPPANIRTTREHDGSVYLIQYGPHFKIGRGSELERRVKQVKIALPESGELIHAITTDDPPGIEAYWHRRFADKRVNGEWFKLSPTDVAAFKRRRFQ